MPDNAIWAVTGPEHDARMARELAWIATGGQTGIVGPESLEVVAQSTPNGTVRIMPGGMSIAATSQSAAIGYTSAPWQSYMRAIYSPLTVEIDPTGSSGGRTDVVGIVVDDPEFEGTSPDVDAHDYWRPHVVKNAGNNATRPEHFASLGRPFLPLAQVQIPSSTATVTNSMITDIRFLAVARTHTVELITPVNTGSGNIDIGPGQSSWFDLVEFSNIQVPQWATRCQISMTISHAYAINGRIGGLFRVATEGSNRMIATAPSSFLEDGGLWERFSMHTAGTIHLHRSTMGAESRLQLQISRTESSSRPGTLRIPDSQTHTAMAIGRITYEETAMRTVS